MPSIALNAEIISSIVSFAYWGENRPGIPLDLRTVHALALTCRAFVEPALDQLWRRQLTLFNLVKTLPKDSWEVYDSETVGPDGQMQRHIKTTRVIIPNDWPRFDYYAAKIKELGFDPRAPFGVAELLRWRAEDLPQDLFSSLCIVRPPYELVPYVRRIRWTAREVALGLRPYLYIFLNPPLVGLTMDFRGAPENASPMYSDATYIKYTLKAVTEQCPAVRDVEMVWPPVEGYAGALSEFVRATPRLRTFCANVRGVGELDLAELASMPELRKTRLHVEGTEFPWLTRALVQPPFPALVDLTLDAPSLAHCTAFLAALEARKLETVTINCDERPSAAMLHDFCAALAACCAPDALRTLVIRHGEVSPVPGPPRAECEVRTETLSQLAAFTALRAFTLDLSVQYALDDIFPDTIIAAWHAVESLSLGATHGWGQRPTLTFAGLAKVVQHCPRLEELSLAVDAARDERLPEVPPNTRVRAIDLVDSYVAKDEVGGVALSRNLAALFPELERITARTPGWRTKECDGEEAGVDTEALAEIDEGLATEEFWREVEKQVATFALLRDMDFPMDLS